MASKPRVYLDSCYYIDAAKGRLGVSLSADRATHIPYVENLLLASLNGEIDVYASTLVISECMHIGDKDVSQETKDAFLALLTSGDAVKLVAVDVFVAERARNLLWQHKISCGGAADMVHVATALDLNCGEFITTNRTRGPLQGDAPAKLEKLGLRVIEAPQTQVLPVSYIQPLFMGTPGASNVLQPPSSQSHDDEPE